MVADSSIGKAVAALRGELSQTAVANAMRERGWKWSQATVWSVESGERPLRLAEAVDLAKVLDCLVTDLIEGQASLVSATRSALGDLKLTRVRLSREASRYEDARREVRLLADELARLGDSGHAELLKAVERFTRDDFSAAILSDASTYRALLNAGSDEVEDHGER